MGEQNPFDGHGARLPATPREIESVDLTSDTEPTLPMDTMSDKDEGEEKQAEPMEALPIEEAKDGDDKKDDKKEGEDEKEEPMSQSTLERDLEILLADDDDYLSDSARAKSKRRTSDHKILIKAIAAPQNR